MNIELLVVPDCPNESAAIDLINTAVADTAVTATVTTTVISTFEVAVSRGFVGSPTILINGHDPFAQGGSGVGLACRVYPTPTGSAGLPPLRDLRQALKREAASGKTFA
ncbi:thioredoxin family protein [Jatrophihabitans telluris]|uniref:Thioredoxin family protein n=1 Tax=Jatrophihabitans telluris TaxID=2038343 RepID=A0ABY4R1M6_9ACTN|nr:thioredoxin family protein [Jatrophihabitans telluris]UQX89217.1 thioredoxin family protein [Jatrophihabitans telluris]